MKRNLFLFYLSHREAALNPLSFEEKKILVAQIHKLPGDKMDTVLEIIQEAVPGCGEEVEVPLDSLDTLTLRKLQKFVQVCKKSFSLFKQSSNELKLFIALRKLCQIRNEVLRH